MLRLSVTCAVLCFLGCSSGAGVVPAAPTVTIAQTSRVAPLRMRVAGGLPIEYRIEITNPFDQAVTLTSIEIETVGETGAYELKRVRHGFSRRIAAHAGDALVIRAWVRTLQESDTGEVGTPVNIRGVARFDSAAGPRRTAFAARVQ